MKYDDDFGSAKSIAVRAFSQLDTTHTPPSPQNYELFYVHASGRNEKLSAAISTYLDDDVVIGATETERLYEEFLGSDGLTRRLEEMARNLARMIQETVRALSLAKDSGSHMDASIDASMAGLGPDASPQQMQDSMRSILELAQNMKQTNQALESNFTASMSQITELHRCLEVARTEASIDAVTGVSNRASFDRHIVEAVSRAGTIDQNLSLLMIDADRFKSLNDKFGHQTGDAVLRIIGHLIRSNIKGQDLAARYGGEEFVVILPNTSLLQATTVAEKIRNAIRSKSLHRKSTGENLGRVTVSIGVSQFAANETAKSLIARADKNLYSAKNAGRDCVIGDAPEVERMQAAV